jgi:Rod binding domain-containing protein
MQSFSMAVPIHPSGFALPGGSVARGSQPVDVAGESPQAQKLRKSTQDFEALLLTQLWQEMEKNPLADDSSNAVLGAGSDTLKILGMQAMAEAVARAGGIGIARMIYRSLAPALKAQGR